MAAGAGEAGEHKRTRVEIGLRWFALRVLSQKEFLAKQALRRMGFPARLPEREAWRHPNHISKRRKVYFPRFYGYVFVGFEDGQVNPDYMRRATAPHFLGKYLGINGRPLEISEKWLNAVDGGPDAVAKLYQRHMRTHGEFEIGDVVKLVEGPFSGFDGLVENIDEEGMALVTCSIFGRWTPVHVSVGMAVKAA
jgi:transcriptional antiterminator NusG